MDAAWKSLLERADGEHLVELYEDERDLEEVVGHWLAVCVRAGGGALLLGPAVFGKAMRARLHPLAPEAEREGRLLMLDGDRVLQHFTRGGAFDRDTFARLVGGLVIRMQRVTGPRPIRAWGAVADTLVRHGEHDVARELELAWGDIVATHRLGLLCSYALAPHAPAVRERLLREAGSVHRHVHCSGRGVAPAP